MPLAKGVIKDKDGQYTILTQFTITSKAEGDTFREIGQKLTFRARDYIPQGEPSKLKSAETWEKFPSGDDPPTPYPTWDFFELGIFLERNDPNCWTFFNLGTF